MSFNFTEFERKVNDIAANVRQVEQTLELFCNELVDTVAKVNALTSILIKENVITEDEVESLVEEQKTALLAELLE